VLEEVETLRKPSTGLKLWDGSLAA